MDLNGKLYVRAFVICFQVPLQYINTHNFKLTLVPAGLIVTAFVINCHVTQHNQNVSEYDQDIPQSHTADQPTETGRGRATAQ